LVTRPSRRRSSSLLPAVAILLLCALPAAAQTGDEPAGAIRGIVYDEDFQVPLAGVRVSVVGTRLTTVTGPVGNFLLENVPPGAYTLSFARQGYDQKAVPRIVVSAGAMAEVRVELGQEVIEMEEMVVTGIDLLADSEIGLLEIRAVATTVQDAISAELINKAGVSDVAGALKLVVGASIVDGKYATVRGLSDRYTGTTVNGVRVPSSDPRKRAVQVDVFPTGTVESVTVTKAFTPDLQGDFTGGGVDIKTKSIPEGPLLSFSVGLEHDSIATGNDDYLTYEGGGVNTTGFKSGTDLPLEARQFIDNDFRPLLEQAYSAEILASDPCQTSLAALSENPVSLTGIGRTYRQINAQGDALVLDPCEPEYMMAVAFDVYSRSFDPTMGSRREAPGPGNSFSVVAGNRYPLPGGGDFGVLGALTYKRSFSLYSNEVNNSSGVSDNGEFFIRKELRDSRGREELLWGGLANVVWQPNESNELSLKMLLNQSATDEARLLLGDEGSLNADGERQDFCGDPATCSRYDIEQNQSLQYTERTVGSAQFHGRHDFSKLSLGWMASYNLTRQNDPDVRFFRNFFTMNFDGEDPFGSARQETQGVSREQNTRRIWRNVEEDGLQMALDLEVPFTQWTESAGKFKAGLFLEDTDRTYEEQSFYYEWTTRQCCRGPYNDVNPLWIENNGRDRRLFTLDEYLAGELWSDTFLDYVGIAENSEDPRIPDHQLLWVAVPSGYNVPYTGKQTIEALYAMVELPLASWVYIIGGARIERTEIAVDPASKRLCTFPGPDGQSVIEPCVQVIERQESGGRALVDVPVDQVNTRIDDSQLLPVLGVNFEPMRNMNIRAMWSKTLARPTFRELAPVATNEYLQGDEFVGNPDLVLSSITNYDLRWEWFRRPGEVLAASLFYKELENPIEYLGYVTGGHRFIQPANFEFGKLQGIELEGRTSLDLLGKWARDLTVGMNYSLLDSEVEVLLIEQLELDDYGLDEETRQLQGQPEYILNLHITYDNDRTGTSTGLFYNRIGEILYTGAGVGGAGANEEAGAQPNIFEDEYNSLDFRISQEVMRLKEGPKGALTFKAKNLLQEDDRTFFRTPDDFLVDDVTGELYGIDSDKELHSSALVLSLSFSCKW
jgi:TonB-dependent receptor